MSYNTGYFPHMSTGNLPSLQQIVFAHYPGMDTRESEITRIKDRMRELGYNPRSLSMKLFNKPDRLRNLFDGKSQNLRGDTYKAIMRELWPDKYSIPADIAEIKHALSYAIKEVIKLLLNESKAPITRERIRRDFIKGIALFDDAGLPGGVEVLDDLLEFVEEKHIQPKIPQTPQALRLAPPV